MPESKSLVLSSKKLIISVAFCKLLKKIQLQLIYNVNVTNQRCTAQTPYNSGSYSAYTYLFFSDYLFRLFKNVTGGFNYTILNYYTLCNLKLITSAGFNDLKSSAPLLRYSKAMDPMMISRKYKTTRRKSLLALKTSKITNRMNF